MRQLLCIPPLIPLCFFVCFLKTYSLCWEEWLKSVAPSSPKCPKVCYFLEGVYPVGWACCRSSRTCDPFFPVSSKAQWVPNSDHNLWVSCHGQKMCHPKSLGCSFAFTGKMVPFGPWRTDGYLRDPITAFQCPVVPETCSLASITFCGFFSLLLCYCGAVSGAVSARKAVRGFGVSGQLSSAQREGSVVPPK